MLWACSSATYSTQEIYASRLLPSSTDTTELLITPNNGTDTSNGLKINEEFGHDERRKMHKTKKAINDDTQKIF